MQVIGLCRFSYPAIGGFQVEHDTEQERSSYLYAADRMEERFRTFEGLTLPAMKGQTDPDFTFLIVIGDDLPTQYRDRLMDLVSGMPQAIVQAHAPGKHRPVMKQAINSVRRFDNAPCLQFRMDDDDAVALTYVERLRAVATDLAGFAARHRHIAIDFNQGYILRADAGGLSVAETQTSYTTAALALMFANSVNLTVMNFAHMKVAQKMPTVTLTGEDMLIRGHNDYNDSRQKKGVKPIRLERVSPGVEPFFKRVYGIDADHIRALYSDVETTFSR